MIDPLTPQDDHLYAWIDRMGNMEFISDQFDFPLNPAFERAMWAFQDKGLGIAGWLP